MSYPILYSATETDFSNNGLGILGDCVSCEVAEEANGIFELAMQYPIGGIHYEDIADRSIIKAKADQFRDPQLFRVYAISKPMSGIVTISAEHISYDLSGIPVSPFTSESVSLALADLKNNAVTDCPFDFWTDKDTSGTFSVSVPSSIRSRLGGVAGSILDVYGGEFEFDNYTVKLHNNRGMNRGVSIRYGKNLTDIKQEQNCASISTGIYPYWAGYVDGNTVIVELPEKIVNAPGTYDFVKIKTVDFTERFEAKPTVEQLRSIAESYVESNNIGIPTVSLTVSFAQLEQTDEYKHLKLLEQVLLFDTVNVEFPALGVSATAKAIKIIYDSLADRVKSITLGSTRANIADTIATQKQEIAKKPSVSLVQSVAMTLTASILGAKGGSVRLLDTDGDGMTDTLYVADNPDPAIATKVWRWNYEGWAGSKTGYVGPFVLGATLEDGLLADTVTAANLVAGTIMSKDDGETFFLDLDNSILHMRAMDDLNGKYASISMDVDGINSQVALQSGDINGLRGQLSTLQQTADGVSIQVQNILENGVDKVTTGTGYTFKEDGLHIQKSGEEIDNSIDNTGMYVKRGDEVMLQANKDGVIGTDMTVRNYLIIGSHARFEDYTDDDGAAGTACFYI